MLLNVRHVPDLTKSLIPVELDDIGYTTVFASQSWTLKEGSFCNC